MASDPLETVTYVFHLGGQRRERISLEFDPPTFLLHPQSPGIAEPWVSLDFQKCPDCPLTGDTHPTCPFAAGLAGFVHRFDDFYSYEMAVVEVVTPQRTIVANRPLQDAMASIIGLIGATSGCPHLAFFRPMARFHLPFASEQETLVRAFSFHLLREYVRLGGAGTEAISLDRLADKYQTVARINHAMAARLREAFTKDAAVNAIVILDTFAQAVPFVLGKAMKELRQIFDVTPEP